MCRVFGRLINKIVYFFIEEGVEILIIKYVITVEKQPLISSKLILMLYVTHERLNDFAKC